MKVALIQTNAGRNKKRNLDKALRLTLEAILNKAELIVLPEIFHYRGRPHSKKGYQPFAERIPGPSTIPFMLFARSHKVFILAGSILEKVKGKRKVYNTSVLIDERGKIIAKYRKTHLFDAVVDRKVLKESKYLLPGKALKTAQIKNFQAGLSICYDLRFPDLYRRYAKKGVNLLFVPSNFTKTTGQAHWEVLLRARAIENLCYVLAPDQCGKDSRGVAAYGNSMVVDPWGKIIARAPGDKEEIIYANVDFHAVKKAQEILPSITK